VVALYTSLAPSESGPLTQAFEKKHGIKVDLWRSNSEKVSQRTITEARASRHQVDAVETIGTDLEKMTREKVFAEFYSPHIADLLPAAIPAHRAWMPDRLSYLGVAYNTRLVRRDDLPRTYEGFLDPKWKGRIGLEAGDIVWLAGIVKQWGEARGMKFFNALAQMRPDVRSGHTLLTQLVISGEVPVGLTVYSSSAEPGKRSGAPIDWLPVQPVIAQPLGIGLARRAPHPHAALLFADFVLSPEGQALFNSLGRPPASRKLQTALGQFESVMMDPALELDESDKWEKIWKALFLNR
jgi:iron(III) transport system substrate-binding protein